MHDVEVHLPDRPGALAELGEALGAAGVSLEGGGVFSHAGVGLAHFLVADGPAARAALESAGLHVAGVHDVVTLRLQQGVPGQLGALARWMAEAGVSIHTQYSDHDHRLVLVVGEEDLATARSVAAGW
ncbi:ACT domain-containing protein [Ornithinicoccus halotolerans]|uniref:ACT domain-containing protein n=1 Tax=Ornithinicoccus halotolerans TaxID=1748220 RepID=UPI0012953021|nr:ACT domain-containing protein [Ornithinicoccus halotolerans]